MRMKKAKDRCESLRTGIARVEKDIEVFEELLNGGELSDNMEKTVQAQIRGLKAQLAQLNSALKICEQAERVLNR